MKKLSLVLIGIFLSFICLEIFLQTTSFIIENIRKYNNYKQQKLSLKEKNKITILCIGESTTYRQYPIQLDKYLKQHSLKKFEVIDLGTPGITLPYISSKIEYNINRYKPNIIITMMGINQAPTIYQDKEKVYKKYKVKVIQFLYLLKKHLTSFFSNDIYAENIKYSNCTDIENKIISLVDEFYAYNNNYKTLQDFNDDIEHVVIDLANLLFGTKYELDNISLININLKIRILELTIKYWKRKEYPKDLYQILEKEEKSLDSDVKSYLVNSLICLSKHNWDELYKIYQRYGKSDYVYKHWIYQLYVQLPLLEKLINDNKDIEFLKEIIRIVKINDDTDFIQKYYDRFITWIEKRDINLYEDYITEIYNLFIEKPINTTVLKNILGKQQNIEEKISNRTLDNTKKTNKRTLDDILIKNYYLEIVEKILNNNITYICMDYPTMPIQELQNFFKDKFYYKKIIFVSNEENFNKALKNHNYDEIFWDNFGITFGHCTDLGNTMIAENVGNVILNLTDKK